MLSDEIRKLEVEVENDKVKIMQLEQENRKLIDLIQRYKKVCMSIIPKKIYTHKARRNTTVKFMDDSQMTVTRRYNEKDCIETAIAYCVLKQLLPVKDLKKLIEEKEEH